VIARPSGVAFGREQTVSIAVLMIGELLWAAASLYAVRVHQQASGFLMASMQMLCGGALMLGTAVLRGEFTQFDIRAVTASSVLALTYLMLIGSIIGFSAYLWLLRNVEATRVATYAYVNPIVAVFLGWLVIGEQLAPELLAGSALVVIGIALIVTFRPRPSQTSKRTT
jgi:drug/metabolite transporter (DMT)-like permease